MTITQEVRRQQRSWATARNVSVDRKDYVEDQVENLFLPLSVRFSKALGDAGGGELQEQRDRPAKIRALHSSAVLAINVFQYWEGRTGSALPMALGSGGELADVNIEQQFPSGLRGTPPTLDVVLTLADGHLIATESKFTEWMSKKRVKLDDFRHKYLAADPGHWMARDLPKCQQLASNIASGKETFRQLDALQLLKHALGLQNNVAGRFSLLYLYYDYERESDVADLHREEAARFESSVDDSLDFKRSSYQQLFAAMAAQAGTDSDYLSYLRDRYFPT